MIWAETRTGPTAGKEGGALGVWLHLVGLGPLGLGLEEAGSGGSRLGLGSGPARRCTSAWLWSTRSSGSRRGGTALLVSEDKRQRRVAERRQGLACGAGGSWARLCRAVTARGRPDPSIGRRGRGPVGVRAMRRLGAPMSRASDERRRKSMAAGDSGTAADLAWRSLLPARHGEGKQRRPRAPGRRWWRLDESVIADRGSQAALRFLWRRGRKKRREGEGKKKGETWK